jgi:hypothetical protein
MRMSVRVRRCAARHHLGGRKVLRRWHAGFGEIRTGGFCLTVFTAARILAGGQNQLARLGKRRPVARRCAQYAPLHANYLVGEAGVLVGFRWR